MDIEEFRRRRQKLKRETDSLFKEVDAHSREEKRYIDVLHHAPEILTKITEDFETRTSLTKTDTVILMIATALQLVRIYMLPKFHEKFEDSDRLDHNDPIVKDMEREEINDFKDKAEKKGWKTKEASKISWKTRDQKYRTWQEIAFTIKVPYDATRHSGAGFNERNMHGGQHRVKTLGHDPILGWIFGTCNILTDTITITPEYKVGEKTIRLPYIETYNVDMGSNFCWEDSTPTFNIFRGAYESIAEDKHRFTAATFAQGLHLASDKFTKMGLPVPFLSTIDSDTAYGVYKEGYDYLDLEYDTQILRRTLKSAVQAILINKIIGAIHTFFYNPQKESDRKLYTVRTRKILLYSNLIATTSDVIQTAIRSACGDENAIKNFDLGGFLVTLYRLISDTSFIMQVKEEFIVKEWDKILEYGNADDILKLGEL